MWCLELMAVFWPPILQKPIKLYITLQTVSLQIYFCQPNNNIRTHARTTSVNRWQIWMREVNLCHIQDHFKFSLWCSEHWRIQRWMTQLKTAETSQIQVLSLCVVCIIWSQCTSNRVRVTCQSWCNTFLYSIPITYWHQTSKNEHLCTHQHDKNYS